LGHFKEALQDHRNALKEVPSDATSWVGITQILKEHPDAEVGDDGGVNWKQVVSDMLKASDYAQKEGNSFAIAKLNFALFTAHHSIKGNEFEAFKHLYQANQWEFERHSQYPQQKQQTLMQADHTMSVFKRGAWIEGVGSKSKTPVFIVGMMRSGSTLMEQILASHDNVIGIGEDSVFGTKQEMIVNGVSEAVSHGSLQELVSHIDECGQDIVDGMMQLVPVERRSKVSRIIDKQLFNFKQLGLIHLVYPDAVILETTRNFMDVVFSIYRFNFNEVYLLYL
jgi:hypothetical protein